jgi:two-component system sensor histidine kinase ResE
MAQEIERTRTRERDFLANISHDLKTPLTSIQGFAEALNDGTVPPDAYPAVARIIGDEAQRMGQMVGDLLQLSRLEAGELPLSLGPLDAGDLLRETARRFESRAAQAGIALLVAPAPAGTRPGGGALPLLADRGRLEQVLGNLIENAIRHTPSGGRIDLVAQSTELQGRAAVRLIVRDTGVGIPPADLPRIFERFYQADKARAGKQGGRAGSGLGLAIVKELVERHGGTIRVESTVGAGTAMIVTLPRAMDGGSSRGIGEQGNRRDAGVLIGDN